jgi:O-antigen/teichoic acid export membrane protein
VKDNLKNKTISALSWSFLETVAARSVQFIVGIILARLLFPEQFGLIGMLTIFFAVAQSFLDSGFGAALIQKREATQADICSIFYFNIVVGVAAAGLLCLVAPWIAAFYNQPVLTPLTRALSLIIVINSFGLIQNTLLIKQINFKTQTKVSLIAGALSGVIGISLAATGSGVWSLVVQQISGTLFRTVCLWYYSSWRPALIFSFNALRDMFGFGSRMLFSGLLNRIFDNIYLLVIGKLFSATDLGFFTRAKSLQALPSETLSGMVGRVTFPVFSSIQNDPARMKRGLKKALTVLVLVNFPMMIGLAVIARPLVLVMLTEKWAPSIPYVQLLCVAGLLFPLHVMNLNVLQALGRSDLFLRLEIIKKVLIAINIAVTWRWGISAMIYGMIVNSIIGFYLNSYYAGIMISYPIWEQLRDLFSYLIMAILMGIGVYAAGLLSFPNLWSMLLAQITVGIFIYVCLCRVFRLADFMEIWQAFWNKVPSLRAGTPG